MGRIKAGATVACCAVALTAAVQWRAGAYSSDFASHPDEAAHAVSSLLVRDYLTRGGFKNPLRFAEDYYAHYPKVAIGHWPPLYYCVQGVWMLGAGRSKGALLAFISLSGAALAASLFLWLQRDCGVVCALCTAILMVATPLVSVALSAAMPDVLLGALALWAALAWARYLETGSRRALVLFIGLAIASAATHGRGLMVSLVPLIAAILITRSPRRRWQLLAASVPIVLLLLSPNWFRPGGHVGLEIFSGAARYLSHAAIQVTLPVASLALIGILVLFMEGGENPRAIALFSLLLSGLIFHTAYNGAFEDRHLVTVIPAILALFAYGWRYCGKRWGAVPVAVALTAISALAAVWDVQRVPPKTDLGYHNLAAGELVRDTKISLVAGNAVHEGAYIAEMLLLDRHPAPMILRASKALATSTWGGNSYRMTFSTADDVSAYLNRAGVDLIFVQTSEPAAHVDLLSEAVLSRPEQWSEVRVVLRDARVFKRRFH